MLLGLAERSLWGMEFGLLGTVTVRQNGGIQPIRAAMRRAVLAALLLDANRVVSTARLADVLWGDRPPATSIQSLQNHVARLRSFLGPGDGKRIETVAPGYLIRVRAGELDLESFVSLSARGYEARRSGDWDAAARHLRAALGLWRGNPLADVFSDVIQAVDAPRLAQLRLEAIEARVDADLHLGRHEHVIAELGPLTRTHPLREGLHASLMLACYQAGRRAEALDAYQQARRILLDELGVEPGSEMRELHQRILRTDPGLEAVRTRLPSATGRGQAVRSPERAAPLHIPSQLPADIPDFVGRDEQVKVLDQRFAAAPDADRPGVATIAVISGTGGIGKTTLAVHVAHGLRGRFPDGQLYVSLRGPTGGLEPADVLARLLRDLGVDAERVPVDQEEREALLRTVLSGRRALLVLDNARDSRQVRPLLPGSARCGVLVTSRNRLAGLQGMHLDLDGLAGDAAMALFTSILGGDRVAAEPAGVASMVRLTAGLPLAIRIAGARLAAHPLWPVEAMAGRLSGQRRLDELRVDDLAVRSSFQLSYADLGTDAAGAGPARAFRLLSIVQGADLSLPAAAALLAVGQDDARELLDVLLDAHLLQSAPAGRYRLHDLLRVFGAERAAEEETKADRVAAVGRLVTWYLRTADAAASVLEPRIRRVPLQAADPSVRPLEFVSYELAIQWCESERVNLVAAVHQAAELGLHALAWQLPLALRRFFRLGKYWAEWTDTYEIALGSARAVGDRRAEAWILNNLGEPYTDLGQDDKAIGLRRAAADIMGEIGDRHGQAETLSNLGVNFGILDRPTEALTYFRQALPIFRDIGDTYNEARALGNIGDALRRTRQYDAAISHLRRALAMHSELGTESYSSARTLTTLGAVYQDNGDYEKAARYFRQAASISGRLHDRGGEADALSSLGDVLRILNRDADAHRSWSRARAIYVDIGDPRVADLDARLT
jgi:DNA-binding SARP family transcriptional activator